MISTRTRSVITKLLKSKYAPRPIRTHHHSKLQQQRMMRLSTPLRELVEEAKAARVIREPHVSQSANKLSVKKDKGLQDKVVARIKEAMVEALTGGAATNNMGSDKVAGFDPVMGKMQRRRRTKQNT